MSQPDKRAELVLAYRAAGLVDKARALEAEMVREAIGGPSDEQLRAMGDRLRAALGKRPARRRAKNPKPTVQERLTQMLADVGVTEIESWKVSRGHWLRDQVDVMRWECQARRFKGELRGGPGWHVGCWTSMSECVKRGIVADLDGAEYCDIAVDAKPPKKPALTK